MKVGKANSSDFGRMTDFINIMEALFDNRSFFSNEEEWRNWSDSDEDKQTLLEIETSLKEDGEGTDFNGYVDNRLILYEFVKRKFKYANYSGGLRRIMFNAFTLIDNACDPNLDYLEFKPEIKNASINTLTEIENYINENVDVNSQVKQILNKIAELKERDK